jgi:hypothetical protein
MDAVLYPAIVDRHEEFSAQYMGFLFENGLLPEALYWVPDRSREHCPGIATLCDAAALPCQRITFGFGQKTLSFEAAVWHFEMGTNPWVMGSNEIGVYGMGQDLSHATEYFCDRLQRLQKVIKSGELRNIRPLALRRIDDWINCHTSPLSQDVASLRTLIGEGLRLYRMSHYGEAKTALDRASEGISHLGEHDRKELRRVAAFTSARCGQPVAGAYGKTHLRELLRYRPVTSLTCSDFLCCFRYGGLLPTADQEERAWFERGTELSEIGERGARAIIYLYRGMTVLSHGSSGDARPLLTQALQTEVDGMAETRVASLALAGLAEADRKEGEYERGRETLQQVMQAQEAQELWGDLADFTLPGLAKLEPDQEAARSHLETAQRYADRVNHPKALARALLLEARTASDIEQAASLRQRFAEAKARVYDLHHCALTARIEADWQNWCTSAWAPEADFWGL